jgi:hypothetical protein
VTEGGALNATCLSIDLRIEPYQRRRLLPHYAQKFIPAFFNMQAHLAPDWAGRKLKIGWLRASPLPLKLRRAEYISDGRSQQRSKKFVNKDNARRNRRNKIQMTARFGNRFLGRDHQL